MGNTNWTLACFFFLLFFFFLFFFFFYKGGRFIRVEEWTAEDWKMSVNRVHDVKFPNS